MSSLDPDQAQWFFEHQRRHYGPITTQQIQDLCRGGIVQSQTPVRSNLFGRWVEAAQVPALRAMLGAPADLATVQAALVALPVKRRTGAAVRAGMCILGAVLLGGSLIGTIGQIATRSAERAATRQFVADVRSFVDSNLAAATAPAEPATAPASDALATPARPPFFSAMQAAPPGSSVERAIILARGVFADLEGAKTRYLQAIQVNGIDKILQPQRLAVSDFYPAARKKCQSIRIALKEYEREIDSVLGSISQRVKASGLSPREQEQFLAGYRSSQMEGERFLRELIAMEHQALARIEEILNYMEPRAGRVQVQDGRLVFMNQTDLAGYNSRVQELMDVVQRQQSIQRVAAQRARARLDRLANTLSEP